MTKGALIRAFLAKEYLDLGRRRLILSLYLLMPLFFSLLPLAIALAVRAAMSSEEAEGQDELVQALRAIVTSIPELEGLPVEDAATLYLLRQMSVLLTVVPLVLTTFAGAYSIIGEKAERTLEPLLATPLTDGEVLLGKIAALGIPAYGATVAGAVLGALVIDVVLHPHLGAFPLPDVTWLSTVLLLCPLVTVLGLLVTLWISARSTDVQSAQQLSGLLALPLVLFFLSGILKPLAFQAVGLWILAGLLLGADLALFQVVRARFNREEILTRWR